MREPFTRNPLILDDDGEIAARKLLSEHFFPFYGENTPQYVSTLLNTEHYLGRFQYLMDVIQYEAFKAQDNILISGCGAGSEMLVAKQIGFGQIFGVEVEPIWIDVCNIRFPNFEDMHPVYYEGTYLPYVNEQFKVVASGHVVEHTENPQLYLQECMRVLMPDGFFFLEFPNRYHIKELHTGLFSFEWLPSPIRNAFLRALSSNISPLSHKVKHGYKSIYATRLKQISLAGIRRMLNNSKAKYSILNTNIPAPGIIRCVIQKH